MIEYDLYELIQNNFIIYWSALLILHITDSQNTSDHWVGLYVVMGFLE